MYYLSAGNERHYVFCLTLRGSVARGDRVQRRGLAKRKAEEENSDEQTEIGKEKVEWLYSDGEMREKRR